MFHILEDLVLFARTVLALKSHERSSLVLPKLFSSPVSICRFVSITAQISGITLPCKVEIPLFQALLSQFDMKRIAISLHVSNVEVACVHSHANLGKT